MPEPPPSPSRVLVDEHATIEKVLDVLEKLTQQIRSGGSFPRETLGRCVEFFRLFADACHHAKEEDLLFPVLEQRGIPRDGGPIGVMLYEHQLARELTRRMGEALEAYDRGEEGATQALLKAADDYLMLLRAHIAKENTVLFPMGERFISPQDRQTLCQKFCEVGCRSFGGKRKAQLEALADELVHQVLGPRQMPRG